MGKLELRTACTVKGTCLYWQQFSVIVTFIVSDLDEPENPEDIPEYDLTMRGTRVMRTNYSFLWQYLEPSRLLPILVDKLLMTETAKKEAESYRQKFAQNSVIINPAVWSELECAIKFTECSLSADVE